MKKELHYPFVPDADLSPEHCEGINFLKLKGNLFSAFHWFMHINKCIPDISTFYEVNHNNLFKSLTDHYKFNLANVVKYEYHNEGTGTIELKGWSVIVKKNLIISIDSTDNSVHLFSDNETEKSYIGEWVDLIRAFTEEPDDSDKTEANIKILNNTGFELSFVTFKVPKPDLDLDLHYNDDFRKVHETIVRRLQTPNDTGLVLLHGVPGTGKTTYLRYLSFILSKPLIFIPQEISQDLSSLNFVTFMLDHPNSILIIEDAENIIIDKGSRSFSVSSLLNVADGLLSDCLNLQVICTFNTDIRNIDRALLRKGRLIALYEFKPLTAVKAEMLAAKLGIVEHITGPLTLADIYFMSDPGFTYAGKKKLGFLK